MTVFSKMVQGECLYQDADLDPDDTMIDPKSGDVMMKLKGNAHVVLEAPAWHLLLPEKGSISHTPSTSIEYSSPPPSSLPSL